MTVTFNEDQPGFMAEEVIRLGDDLAIEVKSDRLLVRRGKADSSPW